MPMENPSTMKSEAPPELGERASIELCRRKLRLSRTSTQAPHGRGRPRPHRPSILASVSFNCTEEVGRVPSNPERQRNQRRERTWSQVGCRLKAAFAPQQP